VNYIFIALKPFLVGFLRYSFVRFPTALLRQEMPLCSVAYINPITVLPVSVKATCLLPPRRTTKLKAHLIDCKHLVTGIVVVQMIIWRRITNRPSNLSAP
jgi:hypothetical protein